MIPQNNLISEIPALLAADTTTLAPATANVIILYQNNVAVSPNTVMADLTEATFQGYAAIPGASGPQLTVLDPSTGQWVIVIKAPAGGYIFVCTGLSNVPQTIYGYALVDHTKTTLLGVQPFPAPIRINTILDFVDAGQPTFTLLAQPLS